MGFVLLLWLNGSIVLILAVFSNLRPLILKPNSFILQVGCKFWSKRHLLFVTFVIRSQIRRNFLIWSSLIWSDHCSITLWYSWPQRINFSGLSFRGFWDLSFFYLSPWPTAMIWTILTALFTPCPLFNLFSPKIWHLFSPVRVKTRDRVTNHDTLFKSWPT